MARPGWEQGRRPGNPAATAAIVVIAVLVIIVAFAVLGG